MKVNAVIQYCDRHRPWTFRLILSIPRGQGREDGDFEPFSPKTA
ncbi:hypothetical protein [Neobacillus niacini]|nr:hypothetical protein [Neobacillus niacini]MDR6999298.1 hypothetical protein [Neobacillus niacini]